MSKYVTILFILLAVSGCNNRSTANSRTSATPTIANVQRSSPGATPLDDGTFDTEISNSHGVAVVDFYATWCGPCKVMLPVLDAVSGETDAKVAKINVEVGKETASKFAIHSIPCLIVFKDGKEVERHVGGHSKEEVMSWIAAYTDKTVSAANVAR